MSAMQQFLFNSVKPFPRSKASTKKPEPYQMRGEKDKSWQQLREQHGATVAVIVRILLTASKPKTIQEIIAQAPEGYGPSIRNAMSKGRALRRARLVQGSVSGGNVMYPVAYILMRDWKARAKEHGRKLYGDLRRAELIK